MISDVPSDDAGLVDRCLCGDAEAVRTLVTKFQHQVFGLCLRMLGHREDAEDVSQESLVRMVKSLGRWDCAKPLRPWVMTIAANRCRTYLGQRSRRPCWGETLEDVQDSRQPDADPELATELDHALAQLRPEYRAVVSMFHQQQMPYEEIGQVVGRPVGTVKTWLHRARVEIAGYLAEKGYSMCLPAGMAPHKE